MLAALAGAAVLGSEQYGLFAFLTLTVSLLNSFAVPGLAPLVNQAIAATGDLRRAGALTSVALSFVAVQLFICCTGFLLLVDVAKVDWSGQGNELLQGFGSAVAVWWTVATGFGIVISAVFAGHKRFATLAKLTFARAVLVGCTTVTVGAMYGSATLSAAAAGTAEMAMTAVGLVIVLKARWLVPAGRHEAMALARSLVRRAVPAGAAALSINGAAWLLQSLLLSRADGLAENGGFALASRLSLVVSFLPGALANSSITYVAGPSDPLRTRSVVLRVVKIGMAFAVAAALSIVVAANYLPALLGPTYEQFSSVIVIMALTGVAVSANHVLGSVAVGLGRIRAWVISDGVLAAALCILALLLAPRYGANGAAIATGFAYAVSAALLAAVLVPRVMKRESTERDGLPSGDSPFRTVRSPIHQVPMSETVPWGDDEIRRHGVS
ncbi:polysaccharide biosynthesis C-terminal domain-containing protein [Micromonospora sp. NBC_00389]|uniref:lipopolysaccharide biosynthesis protein n=1 Tax=Micromonospora sp. NBC_00389 TaxID=2903586 RepID=UPI002E1B2BA2